MNVAIIGSRTLADDKFNSELVPRGCSRIISGGARGIDRAAERYAQENHITFTKIAPEYEKYGKRAPLVRNRAIVEAADYVLIFWDGTSAGTKRVIELCMETGTPYQVFIVLPCAHLTTGTSNDILPAIKHSGKRVETFEKRQGRGLGVQGTSPDAQG